MPNQVEIQQKLVDAQMLKTNIESAFQLRMRAELPQTYVQIKSRVKSLESVEDKIRLKVLTKPDYCFGDITDLVGFRFVCHFQGDVEQVIGLILNMIRDKTTLTELVEDPRLYITTSHNQEALKASIEKVFEEYGVKLHCESKDSRYTSIHFVTKVANSDIVVEIQVRTVFEDAWSEIEHAIKYKNHGLVPSSAERHLRVLNSYVQSCSEYSEAIVGDLKSDPIEKSGIKPMVTEPVEFEEAPAFIRGILQETVRLQADSQYRNAVLSIIEFERANEEALCADREADYLLQMEKGLCYLSLGEPNEALAIYATLVKHGQDNAMLCFRQAEAWRLLGEFNKAKDYLELAIQKLADGSAREKREIAWLENKIPLKLSYVLWKLGNINEAVQVLHKDYPRIEKLGDQELIRDYLNSSTYYELEQSKPGVPTSEALQRYKAEFEKHGLNSVENVVPEFVDTYAWICYLVGDFDAAQKAIDQVIDTFVFPDGPDTTFIEHKGKTWAIAAFDAKIVHYHASLIRKAKQK